MFKKILVWGGLAFLIFFIAFRPDSASDIVGKLAGGLLDIGEGFADFFTGLAD